MHNSFFYPCYNIISGDKIIFTGITAVIPDHTGLSRAGEATMGGKRSSLDLFSFNLNFKFYFNSNFINISISISISLSIFIMILILFSIPNFVIFSGGRNDSMNEGVSGIKKLGLREMTYKLIFIASSVEHTDRRTGLI